MTPRRPARAGVECRAMVPRHAPGTKFGRYEILGHLASGGMATVYVGRMVGPSTARVNDIVCEFSFM